MARPRWSLKSSFFTALGILAVSTLLVLLIVRKSIWAELEILTAVLSAAIFVYLTVVLYLGVRFDKHERFVIEWRKSEPRNFSETLSNLSVDTGGIFTQMGLEAGIPGLIAGFILDLIVSVVMVLLLAALLTIGLDGIAFIVPAVCIPLFFFYRRVLRSIVTKGRRCRGNVKASLLHALKSTFGYSVWFYAIFFLAHYIERTVLK